MKVAVTGGSGQLGRYVVAELMSAHDVSVLDLADLRHHQPFGAVDLTDLAQVGHALAGHDAVIHLGGLDAAIEAPEEEFLRINTMAAWNVLHAGYEAGIRIFSLCSSSSAYGFDLGPIRHVPDHVPIDEGHRLRADDAYGLSKRLLEEAGRAFSEREGMSVTIIRPCYIASDHVIRRLIQHRHGEPQTAVDGWEEPLPHIPCIVAPEDVARCFRLAIEKAPAFGIFNAAADDIFAPRPTREVLIELYGRPVPESPQARFDTDPFASPLDTSSARRILEWRPADRWADLEARVA